MVINRSTLKAVLPATQSGDTRGYFTSGVQIRPDGRVVATDGHIALTAKDRYRPDDEDFPGVPGARVTADLDVPIVVPMDTIKTLIAGTPKKPTIPILACVRFGKNDTSAIAVSTDLAVPRIAHVPYVDPDGRTYPDIDRVMPGAAKVGTVRLVISSILLKQLVQAAEAIKGVKSMQTVVFEVPTADADMMKASNVVASCVRVTMTSDDTELVAAVMPCRE